MLWQKQLTSKHTSFSDKMGVGEKEEMLNSLLFGEGEQNNYDGVYDYFMR